MGERKVNKDGGQVASVHAELKILFFSKEKQQIHSPSNNIEIMHRIISREKTGKS